MTKIDCQMSRHSTRAQTLTALRDWDIEWYMPTPPKMYKFSNNKKFCRKDHFSSTSFSPLVLVPLRDGYFVILSGERGKHWVLGEKGGIFMRRQRRRRRRRRRRSFGGNSQQQWDRWSGTGWEVTAVQSAGIREKNSMEYPVCTNKSLRRASLNCGCFENT